MKKMHCKTFLYVLIIFFVMISSCPHPPKDCPRDKISFFLYTKVHKPPHELILNDPQTIKDAKFNKGDFKFMIHGYMQSRNHSIWINLREEYFKQKDKHWNIIFLDYGPLAEKGCYVQTAVPSLEKIGECATKLLKKIFKEKPEIKLEQFHFIGFSLGAQLCAQISNCFRPCSMKISRITGCDPAFPEFTAGARDADTVLNSQHADFVDVIHTNKGMSGVIYSSAHYDLYSEDGFHQPGCDIWDPVCSHDRSLQIFAESVNSPTKFFARKCKSNFALILINRCTGHHKFTLEVGEHCPRPKSKDDEGVYRFRTHDKKPYAKGMP